ncbi:MAG TPA: HAD hydrolase family protein [Gammaproteobacteria bacterium]|nr:HAD hydrolase family protein [Gammaproteobacteria bacterium]
MDDALKRAAGVKLVAFDVDGVLTDGGLYIGDNGVEYKAFYSRDGHGMRMLLDSGVQIGVITGRRSQLVADRMVSLGVAHVYQGCREKGPGFESLLRDTGLKGGEVAFVGDDVMDLPAMTRAGLAIAVADAHPLVVERAHWKTRSPGGRGAVREVCELIMRANGSLDRVLGAYLES